MIEAPKGRRQRFSGVCYGESGGQIDGESQGELDDEHHQSGEAVGPKAPKPSPALTARRLGARWRLGDGYHSITLPPEMSSVIPVIHDAAAEARNTVAAATSSGWPMRPRGKAWPSAWH